MNYNTNFIALYGRPIDEARNIFAEEALKQNAKYLFMLGEDNIPPPFTIRQLIYDMEQDPELMVVGGIYCHKAKPTNPMIFRGNGAGCYWDWKVGELFEVSGLGMDCTLIRTELFTKLKKPWFKTIDNIEATRDAIPSGDSWTEDLYFCFPPGQVVYGDMLAVEEHTTDSNVLSDVGLLRSVTDTMERPYKGSLIVINPVYGGAFKATVNHPVKVARPQGPGFIRADALVEGDKLIVPIQKRVREDRPEAIPVWPYIRGKFVEFKSAYFRYTRTHQDSSWFPLAVTITPEVARLCGYWVAEGSAGGGTVTWTFNVKETEYTDDVVGLLQGCFGLKGTVQEYPEKGTRVVTCCSTALADWLSGVFGTHSPKRFIAEEILSGPLSCARAFLLGYWRGDGRKAYPYDLSTTSQKLAHCLRALLIRLGLYPSFYETKAHAFQVGVIAEFLDEWCDLLQMPRKTLHKLQGRVQRFQNDLAAGGGGYFTVPIRTLNQEAYEGPVYNLTVAEEHTYNIHGFAVHNCEEVTKAGFKIMADAAVMCDHIDMRTGASTKLPEGSKPTQRYKFPKGELKGVDLGCGTAGQKIEGVHLMRVDIREDVNPDFRCNVAQTPFATGEFDLVYSSHVLEHFPRQEAERVLDEWVRLLKPQGEFRLVIPNVGWAASKIAKGELDDDVYNVLYGAQTYDENFHKMGFTPDLIVGMLKDRGFTRIDVELINYHIALRAWKVPPKATHDLPGIPVAYQPAATPGDPSKYPEKPPIKVTQRTVVETPPKKGRRSRLALKRKAA